VHPSIATTPRRRLIGSFVALALSVAAFSALGATVASAKAVHTASAGASTTWPSVAKAYSWQVVRPTATANLGLTQLARAPKVCTPDIKNYQGYSATYGKAGGRSFQLLVAKGAVCGNPPMSKVVSHVTINGQRVPVAVWLTNSNKVNIADGYKNGMTLTWKQAGRTISIESTRLHLSEVLTVAKSLAPVKAA
jgi:hypothetical protein